MIVDSPAPIEGMSIVTEEGETCSEKVTSAVELVDDSSELFSRTMSKEKVEPKVGVVSLFG